MGVLSYLFLILLCPFVAQAVRVCEIEQYTYYLTTGVCTLMAANAYYCQFGYNLAAANMTESGQLDSLLYSVSLGAYGGTPPVSYSIEFCDISQLARGVGCGRKPDRIWTDSGTSTMYSNLLVYPPGFTAKSGDRLLSAIVRYKAGSGTAGGISHWYNMQVEYCYYK